MSTLLTCAPRRRASIPAITVARHGHSPGNRSLARDRVLAGQPEKPPPSSRAEEATHGRDLGASIRGSLNMRVDCTGRWSGCSRMHLGEAAPKGEAAE